MKNVAIIVAAVVTLSSPFASFGMDHGDMPMEHNDSMKTVGAVAHEEVVDGVKAVFKVLNMNESMQLHGMEMPKGMKETHHLAVQFTNATSGKLMKEGEVRAKIQGPDKSEQTKDLVAMKGHFGADFDLSKKGKYGVMVKFKLEDAAVRSAKFWYEVK
jgi:hypothetical protein